MEPALVYVFSSYRFQFKLIKLIPQKIIQYPVIFYKKMRRLDFSRG